MDWIRTGKSSRNQPKTSYIGNFNRYSHNMINLVSERMAAVPSNKNLTSKENSSENNESAASNNLPLDNNSISAKNLPDANLPIENKYQDKAEFQEYTGQTVSMQDENTSVTRQVTDLQQEPKLCAPELWQEPEQVQKTELVQEQVLEPEKKLKLVQEQVLEPEKKLKLVQEQVLEPEKKLELVQEQVPEQRQEPELVQKQGLEPEQKLEEIELESELEKAPMNFSDMNSTCQNDNISTSCEECKREENVSDIHPDESVHPQDNPWFNPINDLIRLYIKNKKKRNN